MKKHFKPNITTFLIIIILITLAVMLTGNVQTCERSDMGEINITAEKANVYIKKLDITLDVPADSAKYFADTKNRYAAEYFKKHSMVFGIETDMIPEELSVAKNLIPGDNFGEDAFAQAWDQYQAGNTAMYADIQYEPMGYVTINGQEYYYYKFSGKHLEYREYELAEGYVTMIGEELVDFRSMVYDENGPITDEVIKKNLYDKGISLIESIQQGKTFKNSDSNSGWRNIINYSFSLWVFLIPLVFALICNVKVAEDYGEWHDDFDSLGHSKSILGYFTIYIVLHHLVQQVGAENAGVMSFLENVGVCMVGLFFFYSGYGLATSYNKKENYLKGFIRSRLIPVLLPMYLCNLIFFACKYVSTKPESVGQIILELLGVSLINTHMWYMIEISILYILFRIVYGLIKNQKIALTVMGILVVIMITVSLLLGHGNNWFQGEWWYNTTFVFFLGMLYERFRTPLVAFIRKYYAKVAVVAAVLFLLLYEQTQYLLTKVGYWTEFAPGVTGNCTLDKLHTLSSQLPMVITFVFLVLVIGQKAQADNVVLRFFGTISVELYLIHNIFITGFSFICGKGIYFLCVLTASIIAAALIRWADIRLVCLLTGKKRQVPVKVDYKAQMKEYFSLWKRNVSYQWHMFVVHPKCKLRIIFRTIVCILLVLMVVLPLYELAICATQDHTIIGWQSLPGGGFLNNVAMINATLEEPGGGLYKGIGNSFIIAITASLLATYVGALTAYALEKYKFRGRELSWKIIVIFMLMPQSAGFAGYYAVVAKLKMLNHLSVAIFPAVANPTAVYFIRMYLKNLSINEIIESARIDGAKELKIFNRIIIPIIRPVLALQLTFSFVAAWNSGYTQTLLLMDWDKKTIATYIDMFGGGNGAGSDPTMYSLALAATIVPIIIYILCSKSIISSITLGAIKE